MFESGGWVDEPPFDDPSRVEPVDEPPFDDPLLDAVDEPDPLEVAVQAARNRNIADGQVAFAVAHLLAATSPRECVSARTLVAAEIGPALGLGSGAATKLVDTVLALRTRLPATFAAVRAGRLPWYFAVMLAERTDTLTGAQAREVEASVLPGAGSQTPARFGDRLRRSVDRIDPHGADARRRQARRDVKLIRTHLGDGVGELFARMDSEQLDIVWTGADCWARNRKADGDPRTLDQLRVAALVQWAQSYLHHGDPTYCDRWCTPGSHGPTDLTPAGGDDRPEGDSDDSDGPDDDGPGDDGPGDDGPDGAGPDGGMGVDEPTDDAPPVSRPPTRHGRPVTLAALWDLHSLLGLTDRCGELADSGATLPPEAMRELVAGGVKLRRMVVDDATGELLDLTPRTWTLPRTKHTELDAPVVVSVIVTKNTWDAIRTGTADSTLHAALDAAPQAVRELLAHPWTADELDATPDAYPAPARLAEFIAVRDRHPTSPTAGPTAAAAADNDHVVAFDDGGPTTRDNLTSPTRRWHNLKTHGGWTVTRHGRGWQWTSPRGRTYQTQPYDYRLGP